MNSVEINTCIQLLISDVSSFLYAHRMLSWSTYVSKGQTTYVVEKIPLEII